MDVDTMCQVIADGTQRIETLLAENRALSDQIAALKSDVKDAETEREKALAALERAKAIIQFGLDRTDPGELRRAVCMLDQLARESTEARQHALDFLHLS